MSQGTLSVGNLTFPAFRGTMNGAFDALKTSNSGTSAPGGAAAGMMWLDTSTGTRPILKMSDGSDWINVENFDTNANRNYKGTVLAGSGGTGAPSIAFENDPDTGWYSKSANSVALAVGGVDAQVVASTGVHTFASGISFGNETLATYDEGTFTAALSCGTGSVTLSESTLRYIKIGNQVTITGRITVNTISTPTGGLTITGLPFTVFNAVQNLSPGVMLPKSWAAGLTTNLIPRAIINTTTATVYRQAATGGYVTTSVADLLANSCDFDINLTYFTV